MSQEIWSSTVTQIGADAQEMFDGGVYILFGEPVPAALADISVVHAGATSPASDVAPGDHFLLGQADLVLDEVGAIANKNLVELGHVVVYLNMPQQKLLPGAIKASGSTTPSPQVGDRLAFVRGA